MRSRELDLPADMPSSAQDLRKALAIPTAERYELVLQAFRQKLSVDEVHELTGVSPFFLSELADIVELEKEIRETQRVTPELLRRMKRYGFSDKRLGELTGRGEREIRALRIEHDVLPVYKAVDTCAAEFEAATPYFYSTYEEENEAEPGDKERVVILGSGPNRIGQGIEFDYCCVHAAMTVREHGYEAVMVNCNPGDGETDYDISDRLYFEPLTFEDVANVVANERPTGVMVQFGRERSGSAAASSRPERPLIGHAVRRPSTWPRTGADLGEPARPVSGSSARAYGVARSETGGAGRRRARSATRSWCAPPTCSGAGPCASSTTTTSSRTTSPAAVAAVRSTRS